MSVVVLDEAGMVGTRDLAELARHAHEAGAKLVLVGDDAQLSEIAAGGSFRALAQSLGAIELTDNRRQERGWEHQALVAIREGRAREAIDAYLAHGRIHVAPGAEAARRELVADWFAAHRQGHEALMIAPRLTDAAELSRAARGLLVAAGEVGGPERQLALRAGRRRRAGDGAAQRSAPRGPERDARHRARPGARGRPPDRERRRRHARAVARPTWQMATWPTATPSPPTRPRE